MTGSGREGDDRRGESGSLRFRGTAYRATGGTRVVPAYPSRVDLHVHSNRSDGVLEPLALVEAAAAVGVRLLALGDHDTLAGVRELMALGGAAPPGADMPAPTLPLELLPAVEINSVASGIDRLWEGELHILGLGVDPSDDAFEAALERQRQGRAHRFELMVERLRELGLGVEGYLPDDGAAAGVALGRPRIARSLVAAGHATSVDDAMQRLLARGRPAYIARQGLGPREAIATIAAAGGLPVLAHFPDAAVRSDLIRELIEAGLRGLEVHHRRFDAETVAEMEILARELRLVPTGGSDYHGDGETYAEAHATIFVPEEDAAAVFASLGRSAAVFPLDRPVP
ncbi:MAG: PHP domain-containing protein [Candidatus Limnocylindrales bacterium]